MLKTRAAFLLLAAPLAFAAPASADPTVPGCWGAASATYCDATLRAAVGGTGDSEPTPVCAGSCVYVGVPTVDVSSVGAQVCIDYETPQGYSQSDCWGDVYDTQQITEGVLQAFCRNHPGKPPAWCNE